MCGFCTVWMWEAYVIMWVWIWWVTAFLDYPDWGFSVLFLSCKANARVKLAKSGHGPHLFRIVNLCCACHCVMLLSYIVIMLYCYCVALLLFVLSYVLIVCTVPLPPGVNPIAVDKYIYLSTKVMWSSYIFNQTWRGMHCERCGSFFIMQILICSYTSNTMKWTRQLNWGPHHIFTKSDVRRCLQQNGMDSWRTLHVVVVLTVSCHINRASWQNNMFYSPTTEIY